MFESMKKGMSNTRQRFTERMNVLLDRGPHVDEEFWDGLEEALIFSDVGAATASSIIEVMREEATRKALPDAYAVMDELADSLARGFATAGQGLFDESPVVVLFVGINGAGKTTTVGKIAAEQKAAGRNVIIGSADTFRAAAIEQLEVWANRADVQIVQRERGSDPASVCYDTIERAEEAGADLVLIDTAGRLHTSDDLMRELGKVVGVVRKRSKWPVRTVLVLDATTGQNGLSQARQFNDALDLDAVIVTKLDGTAKGGIALAVSHELGLPIAKVGVGERLEDLQEFDAFDFAAALIGAEPSYVLVAADGTERVVTKAEFEAATRKAKAPAEPVSQPAPEPEPALALEAEPEPEPQPELEAESVPEPASEPEAEPEGEPETEAEPGPESEAEAEPESESEAESEHEAEAEPEAESEPEVESEVQAEGELEDEAAVDDVAGVGDEEEPGTDSEAQGDEPESGDEAAAGGEAEDETGSEGEAATESESDETESETDEKPAEGRFKRFFKWLGSTD